MAGIYLHIPFCYKRCNYCDFFSVAGTARKAELVDAMEKEIRDRADSLDEPIETIYFGGGTPSVLKGSEIARLLEAIYDEYKVAAFPEITFEANPDDITSVYLSELKQLGINRLSLGLQSLYDEHLQLMNRRHDSAQSLMAMELALETGFENFSVDLIYGFPNLTLKMWEQELMDIFLYPVPHISAYHLTIEPKTVFEKWLEKEKIQMPDEEESFSQFKLLRSMCKDNGLDHYEISNFAKPGFYSQHNMHYWSDVKYLGIGPSAHSYDLSSREWNISDIARYITGINKGERVYEKENLDKRDHFNEYFIRSLRTKWGINLHFIQENFGDEKLGYVKHVAKKYLNNGMLVYDDNNIRLTEKGLFISDTLLEDFLII
ncbi:MAG: radical SAM family heme chaperone HemW [Bacteroidales bacterium]